MLLLLPTAVIRGQSVFDGFDPNANGTVYVVVVQPDGGVLFGGSFTTLEPNGAGAVTRNRIARLNPDGLPDPTFNPNSDDEIYSIAVQADGKILVGGRFTNIGGQSRNGIARLDAVTGEADSFNPSGSGFHLVNSIAVQADGKILAGGQFSTMGGQSRNNIARLDATTGLADSFDPNANGPVLAIATQPDGKILAGGSFNGLNSIGGQTRNRMARLDATTGMADTFNPNANHSVRSIAIQADGKVLVGGDFNGTSSIGGATRNRIARLNAKSGLADSFNPNANDSVLSLAVQADGKILAGGLFHGSNSIGGQARDYIARLDATTGSADSFAPNPNGIVDSVAVQLDGKILAGGVFGAVAPNGETAVTRKNIARLEADGRLDRNLSVAIGGDIFGGWVMASAVQPDGKIIIGGHFASVFGVQRQQVARLNSDGTLDPDFQANATGAFPYSIVNAIAVQPDGKILVAGFFTSINGQPRNNLARLEPEIGATDSFNPNANNAVTSIMVRADGKILAAGSFDLIGGQSRRGIARLDAVFGLPDSFNPLSSSTVDSIALQQNGKILVGGTFGSIGGQFRSGIARLDPATASADSFNPFASSRVGEIVVLPDGKILVGGDFTSIGGQSRHHIARLDPITGLADSFNPNANNIVVSMALQGNGKVLVGGSFDGIGGQNRRGLARVDIETGLADSFNPDADYNLSSVMLQGDGKILAGGSFTTIGGQRRSFFARLTNDAAALSHLGVTETAVTWTIEGAGPQFARVTFEYSNDNGSFVPLGNGAPAGSNWILTGLNLPLGQNFYVRARGFYQGSYRTGSGSITESIRNAFLTSGPTPSPSPTPIGTPSPSPTPILTPTPTPTPIMTATPTPNGSPACFLAEDFGDVTTLPGGGWVEINHSGTIGTTGWFQGNGSVFPAQSGDGPSYIAANFQNGGDSNGIGYSRVRSPLTTSPPAEPGPTQTPTPTPPAISNWLLTPPVTLQKGATMTFYTRTVDAPQFPDRLQVRMSTNGISTDVGTTSYDVGDFTTLMLDINPGLTTTGYPNVWTQFTVTVTGVPTLTTGRLALRYFVPGGGPNSFNADYIGIDTLRFNGIGPCPTPTPSPTSTPGLPRATLGNISTRLRVEVGDNALIGGFIVTGSQSKKVILRAIGPSLPVSGVLVDPKLELRDSSGGLIRSNDNWRSDQEAEIIATGIPPINDSESAMVETLPANGSAYTAIVRGANNGTGVGLVEVYDLDQSVDSKLANISTRGLVQTGDNAMIAGMIVLGQASQRVLVRALGPSLLVAGKLADPTLELRDGNGGLIRANDNWREDPPQEAEIIATGIPPTNDLESAVIDTLPANGAGYTAIVRGANDATGVALVEVYDLGGGPAPTPTPTPSETVTPTPTATPTGTPLECTATRFSVSAPAQWTVGLPFSFTVEAWCSFAHPDPNYHGIVHFTSSDGAAELPADSGINIGGSFTATLHTLGNWTITATDTHITGTSNPIHIVGPCTENFDGVTAPALPANWVASNPVPGDGVMFVTSSSTPDSEPNDAFIPDQDGISDKVLDLPGITINSASATLTFRNNFSSEMSNGVFWDGGVLEVSAPSISNGDFLDITDSRVGGTIVSGGYTGKIISEVGNPLAGRMAWSGDSGGYISTVINLGPILNGQTITLRWRFGSDVAVAAPGWRIDNLSIMGASCF